jgi:hypothetical protein
MKSKEQGTTIYHVVELTTKGWLTSTLLWLATKAYSIPNGPPGPSPARARSGPARCSPTLCILMAFSCRAVSGVGPDWRPRHDPMAYFSGWTGTMPKTARWAAARPDTIEGAQARLGRSSAPRGRRRRRARPAMRAGEAGGAGGRSRSSCPGGRQRTRTWLELRHSRAVDAAQLRGCSSAPASGGRG